MKDNLLDMLRPIQQDKYKYYNSKIKSRVNKLKQINCQGTGGYVPVPKDYFKEFIEKD